MAENTLSNSQIRDLVRANKLPHVVAARVLADHTHPLHGEVVDRVATYPERARVRVARMVAERRPGNWVSIAGCEAQQVAQVTNPHVAEAAVVARAAVAKLTTGARRSMAAGDAAAILALVEAVEG